MVRIALCSVFFFCCALSQAFASEIQIIGHRGASWYAPENTLASAKMGWDLGADATETDIFLTRDGRLVCIHDETTKRTGGIDLTVAGSTAEELRQLDVGSFKGAQFKGEKIPFLEEMIAAIPQGKKFVVEIKIGPEAIPALQQVVMKSGKASQLVFIAFDFEAICAAKAAMPLIPAYWLTETEKDPSTGAWKPYDIKIIKKVQDKKLDGVNVCGEGLDQSFIDACHQAGLQVLAWTINGAKEAWQLKKMKIDGITTDRPDYIRKALGAARRGT